MPVDRWSGALLRGLVLFASALGHPSIAAGQAEAPFSSLSLSAGLGAHVGRDQLREYWRPGRAVIARVETPFHVGSVAVSVARARFAALRAEQPDFVALSRSVEWNLRRTVIGGVDGFAGGRVGAFDMRFENPPTARGNPDENELLAGLQAGIRVRLPPRTAFRMALETERVFTRVPMDISVVTAALEYGFPTPAWMVAVLR